MGERFLININCSAILNDVGATHYTMFIDSSKMSIVYELVEWIRWMFSLENCIYLTHENSVIHELEDIQLLSNLKYFDILPCGQPHCVHKKAYRDLLKNLNLIVSWNEMKVHKYFLDKVNQMSQKLNQDGVKSCDQKTSSTTLEDQESTMETSKKVNFEENKFHSTECRLSEAGSADLPAQKETQKISHSKPLITGQSQSKTDSFYDKIKMERENFLLQLSKNFSLSNASNNSMNKSLDSEKPDSMNVSTSTKDLVKKESKSDQEGTKSNQKPKKSKYIRPFSLGEILTSIREDFEKKNVEQQPKENTCQDDSLKTEEGSSDKETTPFDNLPVQDRMTGDRKRQRTRKRKRSKKQISEEDSFAPYSLEKKKGLCSLSVPYSNSNIKPNHIRFDVEAEDYVMESESTGEHNENEFEISNKELGASNTAEFPNNDQRELFSVLNGEIQDLQQKSVQSSPEKSKMNAMECSPLSGNRMAEQNLIDLPNETCGDVSQAFSSPEVNGFNQELNELLSLREKFKRGIVIQRFY